jgi:hypothetical protein
MMEELTHPVELTDEELDLVAAGNPNSGNNVGNNELIGVGDVNVLSNFNIALVAGSQTAHG